jgi:hypothetical protein
VTYGAASNLDDLLYLHQVDVAITQADVFDYFRTQRKISNLEHRVNYIIRLPVSEMHVLARNEIQTIEDLRGKGEFRTGGKRLKPDRNDRVSAPGRAGGTGAL